MVVEVPAMSSGADSKLSKAVRNSLWTAQNENRVIVGLSEAVRSLSTISDDALFCIMAPPKKGDTATHMHEVLLQAYCFENDIYLIQVDSSEKLSRLLGANKLESCALITRSISQDSEEDSLSDSEMSLVDYCEKYWVSPEQPVIKLPDK